MYMRFVKVKYKPGAESAIRAVYDTAIIPRLEQIDGCLCVCAIASEKNPEEGISLTLWETPEYVKAYEESGVYEELLAKVRPFLLDSAEWRVQLSRDFTLEYQPVQEEPVIKTFSSTAQMNTDIPEHGAALHMYLRIVSLQLQPGKLNEFNRIYDDEILPALKKSPGCRFAFMTVSSDKENEVVCVSIWRSRQDADAYEKSGLFEKMRERTKHTYSEFYQWKMALERQHKSEVATSEDMKRDTYRIVAGKSFK